MRPLVILLVFAIVFSIVLVVVSQLASAGTADAPEIADAAGDCALPYGNEYLDITAAWVDNEDADLFDVHIELGKWTEAIAEGGGYAVQFVHQGVQWGVIGFYSPAVEDGWAFWTGQATLADLSNTVEAAGAFDAATSTMVIPFAKDIFPHVDANDTTLREFHALSVDVRPAYPFIAAADTPAGTDPDGRWVACDEAISDATFTFSEGGHSSIHAEHQASSAPDATATSDAVAPLASSPDPTGASPRKDAPIGALGAIGAVTLAVLARKR